MTAPLAVKAWTPQARVWRMGEASFAAGALTGRSLPEPL